MPAQPAASHNCATRAALRPPRVSTLLAAFPTAQGGALLNIRDALGIGDWAAEAIVAAAKFGAVVRIRVLKKAACG